MGRFGTEMADILERWKQPGSGVEIGLSMGGAFTAAVAIYYPLCLYVAKAVRDKKLSVPAGPLKLVTFCYNAVAGALSNSIAVALVELVADLFDHDRCIWILFDVAGPN